MANHSRRLRAIAQVADCKPSELTEESYSHYGLPVYSLGSMEFAVGRDSELDDAASEYIQSSLWAFTASFLESHTGLDAEIIEIIQREKYEDATPIFAKLIEANSDIDDFIDEAISSDGRGHFLSSYDGQESEVAFPGKRGATCLDYFYVVRIN